jgi:hypothetical protein
MVVFSAATTSPWQFGVTLLDANGNFVDVLYNVLGSINGSVVRNLQPGSYQIKVSAKDAWTVTVRQPASNTEPLSLPSIHSGIGPSIIGPFPPGMPLSVLFGFLSNGDAWPPASVQVIYLDGRKGSILVSETSQKIVTVHLAAAIQPFYLQAYALGNWQLTVSDASGWAATSAVSMKPRSPSRSTKVSPRKTARSPSRSDQDDTAALESARAGGWAVAGFSARPMATRAAASGSRQTPQNDRAFEAGMATLSGEWDSR